MKKLAKERKATLKKILMQLKEDYIQKITEEMTVKKEELSDDRNQAPMDLGDLSILDFQQSMENTLLDRETTALQRVDKALERLKDGTYGTCQICKKDITIARLQAMPFAEHCITCQGKKESSNRFQ